MNLKSAGGSRAATTTTTIGKRGEKDEKEKGEVERVEEPTKIAAHAKAKDTFHEMQFRTCKLLWLHVPASVAQRSLAVFKLVIKQTV